MTETEQTNTVINGNNTTHSRSLHVSGLPLETTEEDIMFFFKNYNIKSTKIFNKNSKIYANAVFDDIALAEKAREDLNGLNLIPRYTQTGISKPISIAVLETNNFKETIKTDLDRNILVKNISKNVTGRDFYLMMRKAGDVKLCKLVVDYYGVSKGYGYVYYCESKSAEEAMGQLQGKEIDGKFLLICHLIPGKTKENSKNNLYVKNIPSNFSDEDLKKLFEKFGEIKSAVVLRDVQGEGRGFGFVCFTNPGNANQALREMKNEKIKFPGLEFLYLSYAQKKDERVELLMKDSFKLEQLSVFARLREDMYIIKTSDDFEKEIKSFLKLLMVQEYSPRDIKIKMESRTALITVNSQKDVEVLMNKYVDYCSYCLPRVILNYYQNKNERTQTQSFINEMNSLINPINMFSNFKNLSVFDPNNKPIILIDPNSSKIGTSNKNYNKNGKSKKGGYNYNQREQNYNDYNDNYGYNNYSHHYNSSYNNHHYNNKNNQRNPTDNNNGSSNLYPNIQYHVRTHTVLVDLDDKQSIHSKQSAVTPIYEMENKDEAASYVYDIVVNKYPENAGKITGMIFDLGLREMKRLLEKKDQLDKIIEEANEMLNKEK